MRQRTEKQQKKSVFSCSPKIKQVNQHTASLCSQLIHRLATDIDTGSTQYVRTKTKQMYYSVTWTSLPIAHILHWNPNTHSEQSDAKKWDDGTARKGSDVKVDVVLFMYNLYCVIFYREACETCNSDMRCRTAVLSFLACCCSIYFFICLRLFIFRHRTPFMPTTILCAAFWISSLFFTACFGSYVFAFGLVCRLHLTRNSVCDSTAQINA